MMNQTLLRDLNGAALAVLRTGETVLPGRYGFPKTYANRTQALRKASALKAEGMTVKVIQRGRPFYIRVNNA